MAKSASQVQCRTRCWRSSPRQKCVVVHIRRRPHGLVSDFLEVPGWTKSHTLGRPALQGAYLHTVWNRARNRSQAGSSCYESFLLFTHALTSNAFTLTTPPHHPFAHMDSRLVLTPPTRRRSFPRTSSIRALQLRPTLVLPRPGQLSVATDPTRAVWSGTLEMLRN